MSIKKNNEDSIADGDVEILNTDVVTGQFTMIMTMMSNHPLYLATAAISDRSYMVAMAAAKLVVIMFTMGMIMIKVVVLPPEILMLLKESVTLWCQTSQKGDFDNKKAQACTTKLTNKYKVFHALANYFSKNFAL